MDRVATVFAQIEEAFSTVINTLVAMYTELMDTFNELFPSDT